MSPQSGGFLAEHAVELAALSRRALPTPVWCRGWPVAKQQAVNSGDSSSAGHCGGTKVNSAQNTAL